MTARSTRHRLLATGAVLAAGTLALTACGSQGGTKATTTQPSAAASKAPLFDKLPAAVQKAGVVKVGSEVAYAPVEFMQSGKPVGIDPDLAEALGKQLGVTFQIQNTGFDTLITGLDSKRFDLAMSAITDNKERQGKGVDFVDYFSAGTSILVKKGNPEKIQTLDDLCGKTVALQKATTNEDIAKEQAKKCDADGKGKLTIQAYAHDGEALLKIKGGGAVADLNDFPVAAYNAQTSGGGNDFEVVGDQIQAGLYGIAVSKENTQLRDAVKAALDALIANGEYAKILDKWQVKQGAVSSAQVNGGS
ncbi:ABC transporter substrate-binding protein [Streptacidiphilus sp. ASG 303]|uniref:ABC transporter substrate-binding protein n=1 Tax=Streptacidiphilus sp. ASG 303 TaxID=2896847 RepID=UPI001E557000|nr:ABC transporter substrate-binding protein [Streptacidiphilus sp. ASG 303]MCD0482895.1 ABC transporter substrate-binding protein [Streptacidiphilus sp. ASG 303]